MYFDFFRTNYVKKYQNKGALPIKRYISHSTLYQVFGHNPNLILKPSPMDHLGEIKRIAHVMNASSMTFVMNIDSVLIIV